MTKPGLMHSYEAQSVLISHNLREGILFITLHISEKNYRNYDLNKDVSVCRSQGEGEEKGAASG